jgi:phosphatidylglycerol:prolipoprotein diacylglycerol transferase
VSLGGGLPDGGPEPRHPSQLYEAALEGVVLFLVLRLLSHRYKLLQRPGFLAGAFRLRLRHRPLDRRALPGPGRPYRLPRRLSDHGHPLSLPMILAGIAAMVWSVKRTPRAADQ